MILAAFQEPRDHRESNPSEKLCGPALGSLAVIFHVTLGPCDTNVNLRLVGCECKAYGTDRRILKQRRGSEPAEL